MFPLTSEIENVIHLVGFLMELVSYFYRRLMVHPDDYEKTVQEERCFLFHSMRRIYSINLAKSYVAL